jgi:hypothetical protein
MIKQKIGEFDLMVSNREIKINALTEEARAKLKSGDRNSAKHLLFKIKFYEIYQKIMNKTIYKLEEKNIKLEMLNNYSNEDLNEFEQSYYSIIKNLDEEIKKATLAKKDEKEIDDDLSKLEGNKIGINFIKFMKWITITI